VPVGQRWSFVQKKPLKGKYGHLGSDVETGDDVAGDEGVDLLARERLSTRSCRPVWGSYVIVLERPTAYRVGWG
jgi:hypothetical protein